MELFSVVVRTLFFYFFVTIAYRLMGKREIGQLGIIDLIVSILIAEMVAISIENNESPIYLTVIPISLLVILEMLLAYISLKSTKIRSFLEGKPSVIIAKGKINYHEMVKQRYSLEDLLISLRQNSIKDIRDVEFALLESNGKLSIFKYELFKKKGEYPLPLIVDGTINKKTLNYLNKNELWLKKKLYEYNLITKDVFYAFCKNDKIFIIKK